MDAAAVPLSQLMEFGWKWLLPGAVLNLLVTAGVVIYLGL